MRNKKGLKVQLDSTRVKLQNVRDRWLLNSRSVDYEAFLKSVFLLIHSKKEALFAQKTKMTDGVLKDFQNLENFIENNRVIEEIKQLSKIKIENVKTFEFAPGEVLIHKYSKFLKDDTLYQGELQKDGKLIYQVKGSKKQANQIEMANLSVWVEPRPLDENRTKATTANYLRWIEDLRVDNCDYRVCVQSERDLIIRNCAIYTKKHSEAENLMNYLLVRSKGLDKSKDLLSFVGRRWQIKCSEWFYGRLLDYYYVMSGLDLEEAEANRKDQEFKSFLGEGQDSDLPLFLNRGFASFGSISIMKSKRKVKRGIKQWRNENLEALEIGTREFNDSDLPVISIEKIIATPYEDENIAGATIITKILKNKSQLLYEGTSRFALRKLTRGIAYLERTADSLAEGHIIFENVFQQWKVEPKTDFLTLKYTLVLPDKREEDFEFEVLALSRSFYIKAVNYVDFFDRRYVLVIKNLKLYENCTYNEFVGAFDKQSVFIDDFTNSRQKMPTFSPRLYPLLSRTLLRGRLMDRFSDDFLSVEDIEDEYTMRFYALKFGEMRHDLIENNFIKAKIDIKAWWEFANTLKPGPEILELFSYHPAFEQLMRYKDFVSAAICPEDRRGFGDSLAVAILGIKSEVRPIFWEKISTKNGKYKVKETLSLYTPKIVELIYKMVNAKNIYEVRCLFRNHQRIVTHYMKILEDMKLGNANILPFLAREVEHIVLMIQEFSHKGHFHRATNAILLMCSLMDETPQGKQTMMDYFLRVNQREIALLKIVLANSDPEVLVYMFDLGLSVELLFGKHMMSNFSTLFMAELCLRIRDIYFVLFFYPTFRRFPDFDFYMLFKCCLIAAILKEFKDTFLQTNEPSDFATAFEVIAKTYSNFENLLTNAMSLMEFFLGDTIIKPNFPQLAGFYITSFNELRGAFSQICRSVQDWDTSVPRLKYSLSSFEPIIIQLKNYFTAQQKKLHFDQFIMANNGDVELSPRDGNAYLEPSALYFDQVVLDVDTQNPYAYDYGKENYSSMFAIEDTVSPTVFKRKLQQDVAMIYIHRLTHSRGHQGVRFLYIMASDVVVFATRINDAGLPEKSLFEFVFPERITYFSVSLRFETDDGYQESRLVNIDNYEGKIELKRYRIDVIEKAIIPLRTSEVDGNPSMVQVDLEFSILLSYIKRTKIDDFREKVAAIFKPLFIENYWGVTHRYALANFVEQNSLVSAAEVEKIKNAYFQNNPQADYCFAIFDKFIELNYDLVPLSRSLLLSLFYADESISSKLNMLWETLVFFEKLQEEFFLSEESIDSDSIQYFMRVVCSATWLSLPEYCADNLVDFVFYGRIPSIRRALFVAPMKTFDITNLVRSALNLVHFATGQRELNFSKKEVLQHIMSVIMKSFGSIPLENNSEILVTINTNLGLQHFSFPVVLQSSNVAIDIAMKTQESRLQVVNERTRITKERFDVLLPQCGLFSHIYQMKGFYRNSEPFTVNAYVQMNQDYFAACVVTNSTDLMELYEEYPSWNQSLLNSNLAPNEVLVFLAIRPWELFVMKAEKVIFL